MFVPGMYSYTVCAQCDTVCLIYKGGNGTGVARANLINCLDLSFGEGNITLVSIENRMGSAEMGFRFLTPEYILLLACLFVRLFVGATG